MQYAQKTPAEYKPRFVAKKKQTKATVKKTAQAVQYQPKKSCERAEYKTTEMQDESTYSSSPSDKSANSSVER